METRAHYVAVGSFVLAVVFLAFVAVLWVGRVELGELGHGRFQLYDIYFKGAVTGLSEGSAVLYNGVRVGRVAAIRLNPANVEEVRVTVEIDKNAVIKTDAVAELVANLLSGQSFIQIRGGTQAAPVLTAKPGERYPVIASERSALERVYTRAPRLLDQLNDIADKLNALLDRRNRQAVSDSLQNVQALTRILADRAKQLDALISGATDTVGMLHALLDHADRGLSGPHGLEADAARTLGDFDKLAKNLGDTNRQIQKMIAENRPGLRDFSQRTLMQVNALLAQTQQFVAGLARLTSEIEENPARFLFGGNQRDGYRP
ncbi:MAG TPA: MlaD family protein [Stellaceae bacterium]|nr:MlaD family protein [Stellaceae bacterium]